MGETPSHPDERWSFSAAQIPEDLFAELREANLARWPTGGEFNLDDARWAARNLQFVNMAIGIRLIWGWMM